MFLTLSLVIALAYSSVVVLCTRVMKVMVTIVLMLAAFSVSAHAQRSERRPMSFEACLAAIRNVAVELRSTPVNIVETNDLRIVRFLTSDGSVLVTCSRPDGAMLLQHRPR